VLLKHPQGQGGSRCTVTLRGPCQCDTLYQRPSCSRRAERWRRRGGRHRASAVNVSPVGRFVDTSLTRSHVSRPANERTPAVGQLANVHRRGACCPVSEPVYSPSGRAHLQYAELLGHPTNLTTTRASEIAADQGIAVGLARIELATSALSGREGASRWDPLSVTEAPCIPVRGSGDECFETE
jgi:hypothetical protein